MSKSKNAILAVCCLIFLLLGWVTAVIGPVLPELAGKAGVELASMGAIFSAIFAGALAAQLVVGPLSDHIGQKWVLMAGLVLVSIGVLGISFSRSLTLTLLLAFVTGLGHGGVDLGGNVFIALVFDRRCTSALNLLNLFFGLGAFLGPAAVSFSIHQWNSGLPPLWMCVPGLLIACLLVFALRLQPASKTYQPDAQQTDPARKTVYRSGMLWIIGLLVLVYVGTENGIGGWMTTYLERAFSAPAQSAALITGWFWLALTAGRLLSVFLGMKLTSSRLLWISLGSAATSGLIMGLATGSQSATTLAVLLAGFSFGAIYPTMIAFTTSLYQAEPGKAVSVVAAMGSVGGALLPWLQGLAMGGLNVVAVPWFTAVETLLMLVVYIVIRTWVSRSAHSASLARAES